MIMELHYSNIFIDIPSLKRRKVGARVRGRKVRREREQGGGDGARRNSKGWKRD